MRSLHATLLTSLAATSVLAAPIKPPTADIEDALANLGVNVHSIPQPNHSPEDPAIERNCERLCGLLDHLYGSARVFAENSTEYRNATGSYWSAQQGEVRPSCIFLPANDTMVSVMVLLSQSTECPFAAKSGGHTPFAGASSSPRGVTILFKDLNEITLNKDKSVVSVGTGNTWGRVYAALQPHGLGAVGGRLSGIGFGGLTTGGGISYHSNLYGWALDNVESFEVVSAIDGAILTASETVNRDLYWALRGGGNNFGLVTKFNFYTIPSSLMVGSTRVYAEDQFPKVVNAFVNVANNATVDGKAQHYAIFANLGGARISSVELTYTENVTDPVIFQQYRSIPAMSDTTSTKTLLEYADSVDAADRDGLREVFWNRSFKLNEDFANWMVQHYFSVLPSLNVPDAQPMIVFQAITKPMLKKMSRAGGNALGLDSSNGPILDVHVLAWWNNASDDNTMYRFINDFFAAAVAEAEKRGLDNDFVNMNYASQFQDPISSYGASNKARLQEMAAKYDPRGVYQTLQPGHFKLAGAPVANPF